MIGILRKINLDKRASDRAHGKREHEFFFPNESKILVASYMHLRREGLEGNIGGFYTMVRNVSGVMGQEWIEVWPVVPLARKVIGLMWRELIGGVRERVQWIDEKSGRVSVENLVWKCGREMEEIVGTTLI